MKARPKKPTFEYIGISHLRRHKLFDVKSGGAPRPYFSRGPQRLSPTLCVCLRVYICFCACIQSEPHVYLIGQFEEDIGHCVCMNCNNSIDQNYNIHCPLFLRP